MRGESPGARRGAASKGRIRVSSSARFGFRPQRPTSFQAEGRGFDSRRAHRPRPSSQSQIWLCERVWWASPGKPENGQPRSAEVRKRLPSALLLPFTFPLRCLVVRRLPFESPPCRRADLSRVKHRTMVVGLLEQSSWRELYSLGQPSERRNFGIPFASLDSAEDPCRRRPAAVLSRLPLRLRQNALMAKESIGIQELRDRAGAVFARVERGEIITVTRRGHPVARIVPAGMSARLAALVAAGAVRPPEGPRYLPKPVKPRGGGASAAALVAECRR
jgi:prevent-host-death family protein